MRLGKFVVSDLQTWLRSRRKRWEELRVELERDYIGGSKVDIEKLLDDCEAMADALEERGEG